MVPVSRKSNNYLTLQLTQEKTQQQDREETYHNKHNGSPISCYSSDRNTTTAPMDLPNSQLQNGTTLEFLKWIFADLTGVTAP